MKDINKYTHMTKKEFYDVTIECPCDFGLEKKECDSNCIKYSCEECWDFATRNIKFRED